MTAQEDAPVQIVMCGDYVDGSAAKVVDDINKRLAESLGLSAAFLQGDVHYGASYADEMSAKNQQFVEWANNWQKEFNHNLTISMRKHAYGLMFTRDRHNAIKAMRKGKYKCVRQSAASRAINRLLSSGPTTRASWADSGRENTSPTS